MSGFSSKLIQRCLSAIILAPLMMTVIVYGGWFFYGVLVLAFCLSLYEWHHLAVRSPRVLFFWIIGFLYISVGFIACLFLQSHYGALWSIVLFLMVWGSDIGAYLFGKFIGGAKMAPNISPNKTWAGYLGALVFPFFVFYGFAHFYADIMSDYSEIEVRSDLVLLFSLFIGVTAQSGDLFVSFVKRLAGVKDTGRLIPGHGGLLDRIDALILCAPVFYAAVPFLLKYVLAHD